MSQPWPRALKHARWACSRAGVERDLFGRWLALSVQQIAGLAVNWEMTHAGPTT